MIGSAGPTTASRMDPYTPRMLEAGLKGIIGKGGRGPVVREELKKHTAVYMAALGGGGALAALQIRSMEIIAFPELGTEAVRAMEVEDFPVWVVNDCQGRDFYEETVAPWRKNDLFPKSSACRRNLTRRFFRRPREHVLNFFTNWREYEAPVLTKLGMTVRNRARALLSTAQCCGHPGQPGC